MFVEGKWRRCGFDPLGGYILKDSLNSAKECGQLDCYGSVLAAMNDSVYAGRHSRHLRERQSAECKQQLVVCGKFFPRNEADRTIGAISHDARTTNSH